MDKSPSGPGREARPIPTFVGEPHDGNPIAEIIHGQEGIVNLLRYVEEGIGNLHEAALAENSSDEELKLPVRILWHTFNGYKFYSKTSSGKFRHVRDQVVMGCSLDPMAWVGSLFLSRSAYPIVTHHTIPDSMHIAIQ